MPSPAARPLSHQFHRLPCPLLPHAEPPPSFCLHHRQVPNLSPTAHPPPPPRATNWLLRIFFYPSSIHYRLAGLCPQIHDAGYAPLIHLIPCGAGHSPTPRNSSLDHGGVCQRLQGIASTPVSLASHLSHAAPCRLLLATAYVGLVSRSVLYTDPTEQSNRLQIVGPMTMTRRSTMSLQNQGAWSSLGIGVRI
jgi:hypothetical protein